MPGPRKLNAALGIMPLPGSLPAPDTLSEQHEHNSRFVTEYDQNSSMRHILAATQAERNALVPAPTSNHSDQLRRRGQQGRLLVVQPAGNQRPDFNLCSFAHQHFDMSEITAEPPLAPQADKLFVFGA